MIVSFSYPSTPRYGGGVAALYQYADGLARRGHEVHLIHGPAIPDLIERPEDIGWFTFHPATTHHVVADLDDPTLPAADVVFQWGAPARLGLPAVLIQGYKLLSSRFERPAYRAPCPKVCVAGWLTEVGRAWGSPPEQLLHVPLGIDHDRFAVRSPIEDRPVDVAMLHSIHPVKGTADGLAALALLRDRRPDLRAELFGMGPRTAEVPAWASYREAATQAELAEEVYGRARVFLQPSWREGFGLTSVEAMACGAALVTTDNGGSRDYAIHGETASVVPPRDVAAMAGAVAELLDDEAHRTRLARAGAAYVRRFDWDRAAELLEGHLERYLADPDALRHPPADAPLHLEETW